MLEHIKESRVKCTEGYYSMVLDIPEKVVYAAYDEVDDESVIEIVLNYLMFIGEDGKPQNVSIWHNLENGMFRVEMELHYCDLCI